MKPILAYKCPRSMTMDQFLAQLQFPLLATPKIDGIRCLTQGDIPLPPDHKCFPHTRSLKPIPNVWVSGMIARWCPPWLDGELTCGTTFQAVTSGIMSFGGRPDFTYFVFDAMINIGIQKWDVPYHDYANRVAELNKLQLPPFCKKLIPELIQSLDQLLAYEADCLSKGAEGVMVRPPWSPYIETRASKSKPYLVAIKRFCDGEARIIGLNERMHNANEAERNALGYLERSTHQANMVGMNTLGSFQVVDLETGENFSVGTGFDRGFADEVWNNRPTYMGKILKYRFQAHGTKDAPRIPTFLGIRDASDMSPPPTKPSDAGQIELI